MLLAIFTVGVWRLKRNYENRVYANVFLLREAMGGKTASQVMDFLDEREVQINQQKVIFFWQNNNEKRWEVIPQMIDFSLKRKETVEELMRQGRESEGILNWGELYRLLVLPQEVKPQFDFNQEKLKIIVEQMGMEVDRPVQEALFEFKDGKVVNFQLAKEGRAVDKEEVRSLIILALTRDLLENKVMALELPVKKIEPKMAVGQANNLGIFEKLAEGESFFNDSISSRIHNIILASSYLHGVVVAPGEIFSFSEKIGTISAETGYKPAFIIKARKTILEDGGGVCQVSTTLFRAALRAGLPIVERHPHYYRVGFYEQGGYPPGLDATVYPPSPDLKFKNDTSGYLLIQMKVDQDEKRLAFEFYGTNDGRRVELEKPIIHEQYPPPEPMYIDEPSLAAGVIKKIDSAHWGAKVSFKRKVWGADGQLKEENEFWSNYVPWPTVYQRGIGQ